MANGNPIGNPFEWGLDFFRGVNRAINWTARAVQPAEGARAATPPEIRQIDMFDIRYALARGVEDFGAYRTDVFFICVIYPLAGLVLAQLAFGNNMLPLLFPLASGFALIGPVAAIGLYEMSRRREQGIEVTWADAFAVVRSPAFGAVAVLAAWLAGIFLLWLGAAWSIYSVTLGPEPPETIPGFIRDVLTTGAGWTMITLGVGIGFLFAVLVLTVSVISFPMLLDREAGLGMAVKTSVRAVMANPKPMAAWGMIVAGSLALGMIPLFLGLIFVMPVLGHATWHLYRRMVVR